MSGLNKKTTIYFDPEIHRVLKLKAVTTSKSISELVDDAVRHELSEDEEDIRVFEERTGEPTVSFEKVLKDLKNNPKNRRQS